MKDTHRKKMVAPIVITLLFVLLFVAYAAVFFLVDGLPFALKAILGAAPLALAVAMIYVLRTRIREIKGGEEDDLGNY